MARLPLDNLEKRTLKMLEKKNFEYFYQNTGYTCDADALANYLRKRGDFVAFVQRAVDSDYARIYKADKKLVLNSQINTDNYGQKAEATRIKLCAALNTLLWFFGAAGFTIESEPLGLIDEPESALDDRTKKASDKVSASDLI